MGDNSYMRDWANHRILARFGLPHLRARSVRFHINGEKKGLYTLLEAPDQEYVFARSFPDYDPTNFALFKIKSLSIGCGFYSEEDLARARARVSETDTPPYSFERGEHRDKVEVLGEFEFARCIAGFYNDFFVQREDAILAYVRCNEDCGVMNVEEGLIDRDLGVKAWESTMVTFINSNLANNICNAGCTNSDLPSQVDVENFLKNFAVYAVMMNGDSPLGNGNNYYLAATGDGTGWKIVAYDHNNAGDSTCNPGNCNPKLVYWSIMRPTCLALEYNQLAGPLLTNATLHGQYLGFVQSFVDNVLGNASFVDEMSRHAQALQADVAQDFWSSGGIYYHEELSPDAADWDTPQLPLLPLLKAREEQVRSQLEAIDAGTFPRGPHLDVGVEPFETCVDWRSEEPPASVCERECNYKGCLHPGWVLPSFCEEATGTCYHGDYDVQCEGIDNLQQYEGMENREDGRATFCTVGADGFTPIKASECPIPGDDECSKTEDCMYDGCHMIDWNVPSLCQEDTGICYHGDTDERCLGVATPERYEGMENRKDGRVTFCANVDGTPLKASECPPRDATSSSERQIDCRFHLSVLVALAVSHFIRGL